jgi:hypothetical protein
VSSYQKKKYYSLVTNYRVEKKAQRFNFEYENNKKRNKKEEKK